MQQDQPKRTLFYDDFSALELDLRKWLPAYLPHWSRLDRCRPSYSLQNGYLSLEITEKQEPWCPKYDGGVRVSNLQTGHWSGPLGSSRGQHHFRDGLIVRDAVESCRLFVDRYFRLEIRARAFLGPKHLAALWLIGFEEDPSQSGEITVMEIFGKDTNSDSTVLGHGIKSISDPRLKTEFFQPMLPIDVREWHTYAIDWRPDGIDFFVDGQILSRSGQSPGYDMQLMLNLYHLPELASAHRNNAPMPCFDVDFVHAWRTTGAG